MRLLHTSDWHIGRSLHGAELLADQEAVLGGLAGVVAAESVDVVLVAGDVYDRAVPSADAQAVLDRVVARLLGARAVVVLTPGHHHPAPPRRAAAPAAARRWGASSGWPGAAGVRVGPAVRGVGEPLLLPDEHGEVAVYGLPF